MPVLEMTVRATTEEARAAIKKFAEEIEGVGSTSEKSSQRSQKSAAEHGSAIEALGKNYMNFRLAATDAMEAVNKVWDFAKVGAENLRIQEQFDQTAASIGGNADEIVAAMQKASAGTVDDEQLMLAATRSMTLGVAKSGDDLVKIMDLARSATKKFGGDAGEAFTGINESIANLQVRQLKQYGIIVNQTEVYKEYAKSIGTTADALDEEQQRTALLGAVLTKANTLVDKNSNATTNAADRMKQFETRLADVADTIHERVAIGLDGLLFGMQQVSEAFIGHEVHMRTAAKSYAEYAAEMARSGQVAGKLKLITDANLIADVNTLDMTERLRLGYRYLGDQLYVVEDGYTVLTQAQYEAMQGAYGVNGALDESNVAARRAAEAKGLAADEAARLAAALVPLQQRQEEVKRSIEEMTRAQEAEKAETYNRTTAYQSLAQSLLGLQGADIARAAIAGLQEKFKITGDEEAYRKGVEAIELQYGLVTKASLAAADAQGTVTDLYWKGRISTDQMTAALQLLPKAAADGYVSLDELGIHAADLKPKFDDLAKISPLAAINAEAGAQATGTLAAVQGTINEMPSTLKTAIDTMNAALPQAVTGWQQIQMAINNSAGGGVVPTIEHLNTISIPDFTKAITEAAQTTTSDDQGIGKVRLGLNFLVTDSMPAVLTKANEIKPPIVDNWVAIQTAVTNAKSEVQNVTADLNKIPHTIPVEINISVTGDDIPAFPKGGNNQTHQSGGLTSEGWSYLHDNEVVLNEAQRMGRQPIPDNWAPGLINQRSQTFQLIINEAGQASNLGMDYAMLQQLAAAQG